MSLDPKETRIDKEAEELATVVQNQPKLNPPFPYVPTPFDPTFFELGTEIDTEPSS